MRAEDPPSGDRRRLRGDQSRRIVTRHAVDIASLDGLGAISFGRLADELSLSKAGIQTLFRTKQTLQLATVDTAQEVFVDAVVRPAASAPEGAAGFHTLIEHWLDYATQPLFPGGCFWGANLPEFDSHPGPVRDALTNGRRAWLATLTHHLDHVAPGDRDALAFQIDAMLNATNIALRLGDRTRVDTTRRIIADLVPPPDESTH